MEQPQNLEELDKIIKEKEVKQPPHPPIWSYVIASIIIPPLGLFLSWRARVLHLVLPTLLAINSIMFTYLSFNFFSALNPVNLIAGAYDKQPLTQSPLFWLLVIITILLGLVGFILGIYYRIKTNKGTVLKRSVTLNLLVILVLQYLIGFTNALYINSVIYQFFFNTSPDLGF